MVACRKRRMLKKPRSPSLGRQNQRWSDQLVRGRLSALQRRPISMTPTLYPFSVRRWAETHPPKPEPMTIKSKSNWLLVSGIESGFGLRSLGMGCGALDFSSASDYGFCSMRKLAEVEEAKELMTEAMDWSVFTWLFQK